MASLPPYETLVRWTVADTTRWLGENGLNDFKDSFKKNGVDGSRLAKLADSDIDALNVSSAKKRIQLKNAVANIDRSRVNSLPKTQGMMNAFRRNEVSEPAPPPRPPRSGRPPQPDPPSSHAPPPPSNHHHHHQQQHHEEDDDNEDAYSWGDDFNYQSDPEEEPEDYENQMEWTQDHNSNNIGNESHETYEDMSRGQGDDEEFYEQPTSSPSQSSNGGGILQQLQRELTLRKSAPKDPHRTLHNHAAVENDDDTDDEDYELPVPGPDHTPSVPPRPGGRPRRPPERVEDTPARPPPRPPKTGHHNKQAPAPPPLDDDELVYDEPEEEKKPKESRPRALSRQLPPVPSLPSPKEERSLPPPPKNKHAARKAIPVPVQPPPPPEEPQEVYEEVDQGPVQTSSRETRPPAKRPQPVVKVPPPPRDELDIYDWYHKSIDREKAEQALNQHGEDGMYLIRKSRRGGTEQQYTLTIYKEVRVYNLPIRKRDKDGKFALGAAKPNELEFDSVPDLVDYFKTKLIMLNPKAKSAAGSTKLMTPMPK